MNMTAFLLALFALTGGATGTWVMMHIWLPDPPPNIAGRYLAILVAGVVGGVAGGYIVHTMGIGSDSISNVAAAAGGGLILSGAVAFLGAARRN